MTDNEFAQLLEQLTRIADSLSELNGHLEDVMEDDERNIGLKTLRIVDVDARFER